MKKFHKKILNVFSNKIVSLVLIPLILLGFWFTGSIMLNQQTGFSVLEYGHPNVIKENNGGKIFKGEVIYGEFKAKENYLGIVILRFKNYVKPDFKGEDVLSFKLKEKGAKDWYYFNNYRSGSIEHQLLYPFGFPVIGSSKDKTYEFEIESIFGNESNAVELSNVNPIVTTGHQFSRQEIFGSKTRILSFLAKKTISSFTSVDFLFSSSLYFLPFLLYLLWILILKKLAFVKQFFSFLIIILIIVDILLLQEVYSGILFGLLIGWIMAVKIYNLESSVSFGLAFILIFVWLLLILFNASSFFNKLNIWSYAFLIVGAIQLILEEKNQPKYMIGYKKFFGGLLKLQK